jgi:hypothetical protein
MCEEGQQFRCVWTDYGDITAAEKHSDDFSFGNGAATHNEAFSVLKVYVRRIKHFMCWSSLNSLLVTHPTLPVKA